MFELALKDLGPIFAVCLRNEANGNENNWFVKSIEINEDFYNYHFECNQWLSPNKADGHTQRLLLERYADINLMEVEEELSKRLKIHSTEN